MGSPSAIISGGFGTWGSVNEVITLGFGIGAVVILDVISRYNFSVSVQEPPEVDVTIPTTRFNVTLPSTTFDVAVQA